MKGAHDCVVYDRNAETVDALANEGATGASSLDGALLDGALRGSSDNASARTGEM
jgi:6-phosphogluconate dehydrogenase (decarboxylating)